MNLPLSSKIESSSDYFYRDQDSLSSAQANKIL